MSNGLRRDLLAAGRRRLARRHDPDGGNPFREGLKGIGIVTALAVGLGLVGLVVAFVASMVF